MDKKTRKVAPNVVECVESGQLLIETNEFNNLFFWKCDLYQALPRNEPETLLHYLDSYKFKLDLAGELKQSTQHIRIRDNSKVKQHIKSSFDTETRGRPQLSLAECLFRWAVCVAFHGKKPAANALYGDTNCLTDHIKQPIKQLETHCFISEPYRQLYGSWDDLIPKAKKGQGGKEEQEKREFSYLLAHLIIMRFAPSIERTGKIVKEHCQDITTEYSSITNHEWATHQVSFSSHSSLQTKVTSLIEIMASYNQSNREERTNAQVKYYRNK
ncbi:hypothetical protein [Vibrio splendidus]|uniref:hypothetical protein n=1 Tax=Vibrio splendidus TaxID=29497 RepID=UPI000D3B4F84|nr:hypothetical protein [Vibrio splendidus]PTP34444.1 hypothetical protein CWN95_13345 [Vibrio splendidus]